MTIRFAYNTNGTAHHRLDDALALIADSGYDGVALTLDHQHLDPFEPDLAGRAEALARRLDTLGLGSVIETGARFLLDPRAKHEPTLVTPDPAGRARRVAFLKLAIDAALILRSEAVSFWAGVPRHGVDRTIALQWLHEGLTEVCEHAAMCGVAVALEPEPGMLVETTDDYVAIAQRHPSLKLALDTGHCLVTQEIEPHEAVRRFAPRLGTIAIEDMARGDHTHRPFGEGDMDVPAVLAAIESIQFAGLVCVELSRDSHRADRMVPDTIGWLREASARAARHPLAASLAPAGRGAATGPA